VQRVQLTLAAGARLEWLPLEAICYSGCIAENHLAMQAGARRRSARMGCLRAGIARAGQPFDRGSLLQHIEVPGVWLERGRIDAADHRLLQSPIGLGGHRCMASLFFVSGSPVPRARRATCCWPRRATCSTRTACKTAPAPPARMPEVVVLRVLTPVVEPAMQLLRQVWLAWRNELWQLSAATPRIWAT
jgi:urease accessory protein